MIFGLIDQPVVGKYNSILSPMALRIVDIRFIPDSALFLGQLPFPVAEYVAADVFAWGYLVQIALAGIPTQAPGFLLRDEVIRQLLVRLNIVRNGFEAGQLLTARIRNYGRLAVQTTAGKQQQAQ